uniref:Uncharacterized protein n=1 Tax=Lepeophtheirus salmonis TaxID=72036 RepID=A0A0K2T4U1_LEPSM
MYMNDFLSPVTIRFKNGSILLLFSKESQTATRYKRLFCVHSCGTHKSRFFLRSVDANGSKWFSG